MDKGGYEKKGRDALREGIKSRSTGLFKWKPDWEEASTKFNEAVKYFRLAGPAFTSEYLEALKESANANEQCESKHLAGKDWETLASELAKIAGRQPEAADAYARAAANYRLNGQPDKAASTYVKAGSVIGDFLEDKAIEYFQQGLTVYEEEERGKFSNDSFKLFIAYLVKKLRIREAIATLKRQNVIYRELANLYEEPLYQNMLAIIVLHFYMEEYAAAEQDFKEFEGVGIFLESDAGSAANEMIDAYRNQNSEQLAAVLKRQVYIYLDNQVARIAKNLRFDMNKVRAQQEASVQQSIMGGAPRQAAPQDLSQALFARPKPKAAPAQPAQPALVQPAPAQPVPVQAAPAPVQPAQPEPVPVPVPVQSTPNPSPAPAPAQSTPTPAPAPVPEPVFTYQPSDDPGNFQ